MISQIYRGPMKFYVNSSDTNLKGGLAVLEREDQITGLEISTSFSLCFSICKLFIQSEKIRANTLGEMEQIKIVMSGAVRLSAVLVALFELSVHSERIRAVTQGAHAT